jgi:uncharacterized protein with PIN domain
MATDSLGQKRAEFLALAGTAFNQMFGSDGQNGLVTFGQREQRACELTDEMARWLMAKHVGQDPSGETAMQRDCPICGEPVHYDSAQQAQQQVRELMTRRGKIEYRRAVMQCPRCRKIFFPPG